MSKPAYPDRPFGVEGLLVGAACAFDVAFACTCAHPCDLRAKSLIESDGSKSRNVDFTAWRRSKIIVKIASRATKVSLTDAARCGERVCVRRQPFARFHRFQNSKVRKAALQNASRTSVKFPSSSSLTLIALYPPSVSSPPLLPHALPNPNPPSSPKSVPTLSSSGDSRRARGGA